MKRKRHVLHSGILRKQSGSSNKLFYTVVILVIHGSALRITVFVETNEFFSSTKKYMYAMSREVILKLLKASASILTFGY